jgi:transposase-like protein
MNDSNATDSPLEVAAGAVGPHVTDAFELLSNEARLAILLALWEAYDPQDTDDTVSFSALQDRIGVPDSGNFNYHLDKLVGHFVEHTDEGYRLRNAGRKIVQAIIAGVGSEERTLPPTEIDMPCYRCGAPVELSYQEEHLYHICTACEGNTGPEFGRERPVGTLMMFDFDPAGLTDRTPGDVFVAGTINSLRDFGSLIRGICPTCSGPIEESIHVCESHEAPPGEVCPTCGTGDKVRVSYVCSVCKHGDSYPAHAAIYDHPAVVAFCHEHGIETTYALSDPGACADLWAHLLQRTYTLVSEDPVRVRVSVPGDGATLYLTLDANLTVVDVTTEEGVPDRDSSDGSRTGDGEVTEQWGCISEDRLPPTEACLQSLRRYRWPDGVTCPHCGSPDTIRKGATSKDAQRYRCRGCDRIFNDLTQTVFAGRRLSLPEMVYIVRMADERNTARVARRLDRSYKSVLDFVHEIEAARERDADSILAAFTRQPST